MHYVYILYSEKFDVYYKGETTDMEQRLAAHNDNLSSYTKGKGPWKLVYMEIMPDRSAALKREKMLKKQNRNYITWLISQPNNLIK